MLVLFVMFMLLFRVVFVCLFVVVSPYCCFGSLWFVGVRRCCNCSLFVVGCWLIGLC